jgi:transposase
MRKRRRFTPEFKSKVVLDVLTGAQSPAEACRKHALSPNLLTLWKATFLERAHTLFQPDEQRDEDQTRIAELEQLLGRSTRQIEILKNQRPAKELKSRRFPISPLQFGQE